MKRFGIWYWNLFRESFGIFKLWGHDWSGWIPMIFAAIVVAGGWLGFSWAHLTDAGNWWAGVGTILLFAWVLIIGPLVVAYRRHLNDEGRMKGLEERMKELADKDASFPVIRMDDLRQDRRWHEHYRILEMRVKNDGTGEVIGKVFAVRLEDRQGERIERIDDPIELHWRGVAAESQQKFFGSIDAHACVLLIDKNNPDGYFFLVPPSPRGQDMRLVPLLTPSMMSYRTEEIFFTVRVVFYDPRDGQAIADKERRFSIKPDAASEIGYEVRSV